MVAAVFHNPVPDPLPARSATPKRSAGSSGSVNAINSIATTADSMPTNSLKDSQKDTFKPSAPSFDWKDLWLKVVPPLMGLALLVGIWAVIAQTSKGQFPGPLATAEQAVEIFSKPFYSNGPNDQGIGWNIWSSLKRVGLGFGLAALVGIPLGFMIGRFTFLNRMFGPLISLLRPVSPLAWLPIGLLVFKGANPAAIWTIFICSIWPMIINTAVGVQRVPQDYMNVARVLNLSEWKIITKILMPAVLPYMLTGVRLAVGTAWLVIVAAEMLTGGVGIGFWVWDEWNNLNVKNIIIAIFVIGIVGLVLEQMLIKLAGAFTYEEVKA
jgi:nitrate/nitrite transport system permease protein